MNHKHTLLLVAVAGFALGGCSLFGKSSPPTVPQPPQALNQANPNLVLPQIGSDGAQTISESAAARQNESQPTKFKTITEDRGPGGTVNRITVDNPQGSLPDYYLTPNIEQQTNTNNNPDKISPPTWQWSW